MKTFSYSTILIMLLIFALMLYTRIGCMTKIAWNKSESCQSQEPALMLMERPRIAAYETNTYDIIGCCPDREEVTNTPTLCNDEVPLLNDNLMANSSLIILSQSNRA